MAFHGHDRQRFLRSVTYVRAVFRPGSARNPIQTEQAHDVIDAQPAGMPQRRANRLDQRRIAGGPQPVRNERGQRPVLAVHVELVRRRSDRGALRQHVLPLPRIGSARGNANRQIGHQGQFSSRPGQLDIQLPLEPHVEPQAIGPVLNVPLHGKRIRTLIFARPLMPITAISLGQGAEAGEASKTLAHFQAVAVEGRIFQAQPPDSFQSVHFQAKDRVAVDPRTFVQLPSRNSERGQIDRRVLRARYFFDFEVERISKPAATGIVGAGLLRNLWRDGAQGVEHHDPRAKLSGPICQSSQVAQIAQAPAGTRAGRVQLHCPSPDLQLGRQPTAARPLDDPDASLGVVRLELMVSQRQVRRNLFFDP